MRFLGLAWSLMLMAGLFACAPFKPPPDSLVLRPASFDDLPGWSDDKLSEPLAAFIRSCGRIAKIGSDRPLDHGFAGLAAEWQPLCAEAQILPPGDDNAARAFLGNAFQPVAVLNNDKLDGLFTGYYEPILKGSRVKAGPYTIPLYRHPPDLVGVDLGQFRDSLRGQRIGGRVRGNRLEPYDDRAAIDQGALANKELELVWVDSSVDAFFLHVQGSGIVELAEGGVMRVGFAAQNGHAYTAIGRAVAADGCMGEIVTAQGIRKCLAMDPARAAGFMRLNRSYVFFREIEGDGPIGAEGVVLTPGRSLALDRSYLPLGVPLWLDATRPSAIADAPDLVLRRLMVAQDTGGAIKGPVRGDIFWGAGADAAEIAGRMQQMGRYWLLLPKAVVARLGATN